MIPIGARSESRELAEQIAAILDDKKALDIVLLDVSDLIQITEIFVVATGTSRRQVITLAEELNLRLKEQGHPPLRVEGVEDGTWLLVDYGDVIVHIFQDEPRRYFDLERLWGDAPRTDWEPAVVGP